MAIKIGNKLISGVECEIHADQYGMWRIKDGDTEIANSDKSLEAAVTKARTAIKRTQVPVAVDFITLKGEAGVAIGLHGRNRQVLTRVGDKAKQMDFRTMVFRPDTPASKLEAYKTKLADSARLAREASEIERAHAFQLYEAVKIAIDLATAQTASEED